MNTNSFWSVKLAETIMHRYPDPDCFPYRSWSYSQGFMLWGMAKLFETTGDKKYYDYIMRYVDGHVGEDGHISRFSGQSMDDMMTGSIIVWAYEKTCAKKYKIACDNIRKAFDKYPRMHDGGFPHAVDIPHEIWVDGVFMGQMFLTKYGKYIGDGGYCFDEAARQMTLIYEHCRKDGTGLLYHAWSDDKKAFWADNTTGRSPDVWSEGLGWYALILVEILEIYPKDHPGRELLVKQLRELLGSLREAQDSRTGLWFQVVDKGDLPDNWHDTSGSAMFVYTVRKAVELGLADAGTYMPVVRKGYEGIIGNTRPDEHGNLDIINACDGLCVQKSYADYVNYKKTVNAKEAVAAFLWAAWIMEKPGERRTF